MARWHDTVRLDCTNRPYIPVKQAKRVRPTAATTIESYSINLICFVSSFIIQFITATSEGSVEQERIESNRYRGMVHDQSTVTGCSSSSSSNNNKNLAQASTATGLRRQQQQQTRTNAFTLVRAQHQHTGTTTSITTTTIQPPNQQQQHQNRNNIKQNVIVIR